MRSLLRVAHVRPIGSAVRLQRCFTTESADLTPTVTEEPEVQEEDVVHPFVSELKNRQDEFFEEIDVSQLDVQSLLSGDDVEELSTPLPNILKGFTSSLVSLSFTSVRS